MPFQASEKMTTDEQNEQSTNADIAIGSPAELIVLACKSNALRCRVPGTAASLRFARLSDVSSAATRGAEGRSPPLRGPVIITIGHYR
jgi:hypothetical protein